MRSPKGFGKNYFTLSAIVAYSVENKLQSQVSSIHSLLYNKTTSEDKDLDEDDPSSEILESISISNSRPCHCNCFYRLKAKIALLINIFVARCPYYTTYFAFRRTGVHPPLFPN